MKKLLTIGMLVMCCGIAVAGAPKHKPKVVYVFEDILPNTALLARPTNGDGLQLFDLNKSVTVIQHLGPPLNCTQIVITSGDVVITTPCGTEVKD